MAYILWKSITEGFAPKQAPGAVARRTSFSFRNTWVPKATRTDHWAPSRRYPRQGAKSKPLPTLVEETTPRRVTANTRSYAVRLKDGLQVVRVDPNSVSLTHIDGHEFTIVSRHWLMTDRTITRHVYLPAEREPKNLR
jgi:hypothetical protein